VRPTPSPQPLAELKSRIGEVLAEDGRVLIICLGNEMRGDDAFGVLVYRMLRERGVRLVINAGEAPENHLGAIKRRRPSLLVVVDALLGVPPGEVRMASLREVAEAPPVSTHLLPLSLLARLAGLREEQVVVVGCGVERLGFGEEPSRAVAEAAAEVAAGLAEALTNRSGAP